MIRVEYISTKDINKVSKIHSKFKYINWTMKFIDNEYRFYPPINTSLDEDYDDFDFEIDNDDIYLFDEIIVKKESKKNLPMFGEFWDSKLSFFSKDLMDYFDSSDEVDMSRFKRIKKGMSKQAKIEKFTDTTKKYKNSSKTINLGKYKDRSISSDSYKLYKVKGNKRNLKTEKYKEKEFDFIYTYKVNRNKTFKAKINKYEEIELLI